MKLSHRYKKNNHPKTYKTRILSPIPTTRHTSTHQRENTEKDVAVLLHLERTLPYTLIKGGLLVRLESVTAERVQRATT